MHARFLVTTVALALAACGGGSSLPPGSDAGQDTTHPQYDAAPKPDTGACQDLCTAGDKRCVTGGYQLCGDSNGDGCTEWQVTQPCPTGQKCVDGECQTTCTDACAAGNVKCTDDGTGTQACVSGASGCKEWGAAVNCPASETCTSGKCSASCVDECTAGSKQCSGSGYRACGQYDADPCLDWGPVTACPSGQTCSNGVCGASCTNECTANAKECVGADAYRTCGDFDTDPCLEWSATTPCPSGQTCSNGVCSATCTDECTTDGAKECNASGTGYRVCGNFDTDSCKEWGPETQCPTGQTCQAGACVVLCDCNYYPNVCEASAPGSSVACACDPDCAGGLSPCVLDGHCDTWCPSGTDPDCGCDCAGGLSPCVLDGHCDTWCPSGADPDCGCDCNYNEYCEAAEHNSTDTCLCDPDCEPHDVACSDDGHCDTWCPAGADPDCGVAACRDRDMSIGWRFGDELWLGGQYEDPDSVEGAPWVLLSSGGWAGEGTGEMMVEFAAEHLSCVTGIKLEVYGYDDSLVGDGAEMYLWNWNTGTYDLLPDQTVGYTSDGLPAFWDNWVYSTSDYVLCGTGTRAKCYVDAQLRASTWDDTHVFWAELFVHMSP